jgi:hypothetical protein
MRPIAVAPPPADIPAGRGDEPSRGRILPMDDRAHSGRAATGGGRVSPVAAKR